MTGESLTEWSVRRDSRLTCEEAGYHLPGCYNPWMESTFCICGEQRWPGDTGQWHSVRRFRVKLSGEYVVHVSYETLWWDVYYLPPL